MADYLGTFLVGEQVRIASRRRLDEFRKSWRFHHPLREHQLGYASATAVIEEIWFYHGGTALYELHDVPGTWHEQCLEDPTLDRSPPAAEVYWIKAEFRGGKSFLVVRDTAGRVCYEGAEPSWENGDLATMSEVLRQRSAQGFASRFGFEHRIDNAPVLKGTTN